MLIGFDGSRAFVTDKTGTENYSFNLLKAISRLDQKNKYRVYLRSGKPEGKWPSNFEFRTIRPIRLWTQVGLAVETWRNPVDVLFVPAHTIPILANPKVRRVVTIHDLGVEYLPNFHKFPQRYYLDFASRYASRHADRIIAVSKATKDDLVKRYGVLGNKVFVVHEGVDGQFFKPQSKAKVAAVKSRYKINGEYILFIGTIQPRKNLEMLIEAFSLLVGSGKLVAGRKKLLQTTNYKLQTLQLVIAGDLGWDYADILSAPARFGVKGKVKFIGRVADGDLPALYTGAGVFAFPSLFEGFGLPILEALSCGCFVAASDIGSHREIFEKADLNKVKAGVLVKASDVDRWADVLYRTITQYDKRLDLSIIKSRLKAKFSWFAAAKETVAVFESCDVAKKPKLG